MNDEIFKKVSNILQSQLGVDEDQVQPDSRLIGDLGADSLDTVDLVMEIEEEFGLDILDEDWVDKKDCTVREVVEFIENNVD